MVLKNRKKWPVLMLVCLTMLLPAAGAWTPMASAQGDTDTYTVQPGDSLWKISVKYQVGLSEIIAANPQFSNPSLIYPGDKVTVPLYSATKSVEAEVIRLVNVERSKNGNVGMLMHLFRTLEQSSIWKLVGFPHVTVA